jgi:phthiocerol/phenolphthiocerol synthesis type-I polyketide synthase E
MTVLDRLRHIWEEQLGFSVLDVDEDFFDLGGDSLMALSIAKRAAEVGIPLTAAAVLKHPTLRELAASVSDA